MGANNSHETEAETTPRRILNIDPRSPSGCISRTPITVQKTPENVLDEMDPRSPTVGIMRTPLSFPTQTKQEMDKEALNVPQLDLDKDTEGNDQQQDDAQSQKEELLSVTGIENISLDDFPTSESTRLVPYEDKPEEKEKLKAKKLKQRATQPKELFPSKKKSQFESITRSPLSSRNVNMDSPLQIVQQKQVKDINMKRSCALESTTSSRFIVQDKENM